MCVHVAESRIGHTSESELEELEEEDDEESLELSEAMPVDSCRSTLSARTAKSGLSCFRILGIIQDAIVIFSALVNA